MSSTRHALHLIAYRTQSDHVGGDHTVSYSEAKALANDAYKTTGANTPHVVTIKRDGTQIALPFSTSELASAAYDLVVNNPDDAWYVALYDTSKQPAAPYQVDETYFGGMAETVTKTVTTKASGKIWGWILGLGTTALVGYRLAKRHK